MKRTSIVKVLNACLTLSLLIGIVAVASATHAATIIVNPGDDLKSAVEGAAPNDVVELRQGIHPVSCAAGTNCITIPSGVTIMADATAPQGTVVVQGGDNSLRITLFSSTGTDITVSGLKFVPDPSAAMGGRAVWFAQGGGNLVFNDNIVKQFTDAVFARNQTVGDIQFRNNDVTIVDRDPAANNGFIGGNAALTVLFAELDRLNASGNTIHGPGRNVERFVAVTGVIVFNTSQTVGSMDIWNNAIKGFDFAIFTSGQVGEDGVAIMENRLHSNGVALGVGQVPDPDITIPTPACCTNIVQNRITGNDIGILIAENAEDTNINRNQIAGNREAPIIDDTGGSTTTIGDNLIRGKNSGYRPPIPPGMAFDPVTGPVGG